MGKQRRSRVVYNGDLPPKVKPCRWENFNHGWTPGHGFSKTSFEFATTVEIHVETLRLGPFLILESGFIRVHPWLMEFPPRFPVTQLPFTLARTGHFRRHGKCSASSSPAFCTPWTMPGVNSDLRK